MAEILAVLPSSEQLRQLAQHTLSHGHSMIAARNLDRARDILKERKPDLVVAPIDFQHGEILGLLRSMKKDPQYQRTQFLLFAELDHMSLPNKERALKMAARALGADRFVSFAHFEAAELWWQMAVILPDSR